MKKDIPDPLGIDEIRFRHCLSAPSYRIFVALVIGWVLTVESREWRRPLQDRNPDGTVSPFT